MKPTLVALTGLALFLGTVVARADEPTPVAPPPGPKAAAPPRVLFTEGEFTEVDHTRRNVGIGLTIGGTLGTGGLVFTSFMTFLGGDCEGSCPQTPTGVRVAAVAGAVAMTGVIATGIVLIATSGSHRIAPASRIKPTATGVAFSF